MLTENPTQITVAAHALRRKLMESLQGLGYETSPAQGALDEFLIEERLSGSGVGLKYFTSFCQSVESNFRYPPTVKVAGATTCIDAGGGLAHIPFCGALPGFVEQVREHGIGLLGIKNDVTFIRAGYPAYCLAMHDLIALSFIYVNHPVCSPVGVGTPILGTNPIAFCCPTDNKPLLYDISTSAVSGKTFKQLRDRGVPIQKEIGVDRQGNPIHSLNDIVSLLPIDGNRGLGMMLMVELLAGSLLGYEMSNKTKVDDFGVLILAIDPSFLGSKQRFKQRNTALLERLNQLSEGKVHIPGSNYPTVDDLENSYSIPLDLWETLSTSKS